jgi:hypothetical protein
MKLNNEIEKVNNYPNIFKKCITLCRLKNQKLRKKCFDE